jgi:hypothetical protein
MHEMGLILGVEKWRQVNSQRVTSLLGMIYENRIAAWHYS